MKIKLFFTIVSMLLLNMTVYGQDKPSIIEHEIYPNWYYFNQENDNQRGSSSHPLLVRDFITIYMSEFNLSSNNELRIESISLFNNQMNYRSLGSNASNKITKYQQYYNGYEVESSIVITHDINDTINLVIGSTINSLNVDTSNPILEAIALDSALSVIQDIFIWQDSVLMDGYCVDDDGVFDTTLYNQFLPKGKLCLARKLGDAFIANNYKFVWSFSISTTSAEYRVLVNAQTGEIYDVSDVTNYGRYEYGDIQTLYDGYVVNEIETFKCTLCSRWRLENSKGNKTLLRNKKVKDKDNIWTDMSQAPATTAHWIISELADFYSQCFGNNNLTKNTKINAGVYENNAWYNYNTDEITLGLKNDKWLSTIDIIGHEMAHKLVREGANLEYYGESGALNESFADIFGTLSEKYIRTNHGRTWNWTIGEDAVTLRNMSNPEQYSQPSYYHGNNWYYGTNDNGGIHTNSGVQNKWFYNLSQSIGIDKAGIIAYITLCSYLTPTSCFNDALFASVFAAEYIYGYCSDERDAVVSAWQAVGVSSYSLLLCDSSNITVERLSVFDIDSKKNVDVVVYPNPASNIINIKTNDDVNNSSAILYNIMGIKVDEVYINNNMATIDISKLANGLYLISVVIDGEVTKNTKIIVNHEL